LDRFTHHSTYNSGKEMKMKNPPLPYYKSSFHTSFQAIVALTFAEYAAKPFFPDCEIPQEIVKILAALCLCLLTAINAMSTKTSMKVQNVFTAGKLIALVSIILMGVIAIFTRDSSNFDNAWAGNFESKNICYAFIQGMFAFGGWNYLNFVTGELNFI
jgi:solute carrier family 7 (L-type amino acid transporter), member 5